MDLANYNYSYGNCGKKMGAAKKFDYFISHASEDKSAIVYDLVKFLRGYGYSVWYDALELMPGSSLVHEIGKGLNSSAVCILVLSEHFFLKHWTASEFRAVMIKHIEKNINVIPIWHGVDKSDVAQFSPFLSDIVALDSSMGAKRLAEEISRANQRLSFEKQGIFEFRQRVKHKTEGRKFLEETLTRIFIEKRPFGPAVVAICDIDDMTKINKVHGEGVGDDVLTIVEVLIGDAFYGTEFAFGQCGDDTFYVIQFGVGLASISRALQSLLGIIRSYEWGVISHELRVTCSIGFVERHDFENGIDVTIRSALGMIEAKRRGGNCAMEGPERLPQTSVITTTRHLFS